MDVTFWTVLLFVIAHHTAESSTSRNKCIQYVRNIYDNHRTHNSRVVDDPRGTWVSTRCEITPGEKFIFRRFVIDKDKWSGKIFHYHDSWCNKPKFIVTFSGSYRIFTEEKKLTKVSSTSDFKFNDISLTAGTFEQVKGAIDFLLEKCPFAISDLSKSSNVDLNILVGKNIKISDEALHKKHCRYYLGLHMYSYRKIRMATEENSLKYATLFFGDIPTFETKNQRLFKPKSFQYGLVRIDRPWCSICKLAQSIDKPPVLPLPDEKNVFTGKWVSKMCQVSNENSYGSEYYEFHPISSGNTEGAFTFYQSSFKDVSCKELQLDVTTTGTYMIYQPHKKIKEILQVKIKYKTISITAYDQTLLQLLKSSDQCGKSDAWKYGVQQNVTATHGCTAIFQKKLPFERTALLRANKIFNKRELYIEANAEKGLYFKNSYSQCEEVTRNMIVKETNTIVPTTKKSFITLSFPKDDINKQIDEKLREGMRKYNSATVTFARSTLLLHSLILSVLFCFL